MILKFNEILIVLSMLIIGVMSPLAPAQESAQTTGLTLEGFSVSPHWDEQVATLNLADGTVRVLINAPAADKFDPKRPTRLILYALPNGNSIEWTMGKQMNEGDDWHFDIQHVAAQVRRLREICTDENIVVACLEAQGKSWPTWRKTREYKDADTIPPIIEAIKAKLPVPDLRIMLTGHSGGGSFAFGVINAYALIPAQIDRIAFLDSNYGFAAEDGHGSKLLIWLRENTARLIVVAYDDREITFNGKKVVSDTGGTWRASHRMIDDFTTKTVTLEHTKEGDFEIYRGMNGQIQMFLHTNPENKILHTVLVGEMNGIIHAATLGTQHENKAATFGGPRAYAAWIQKSN